MNYRKALDLSYYIRQKKRLPNTAGNPIHMTEHWVEMCMAGIPTMPPKHGETWIENEFRFERTMDFWYWESGDVTHVLFDSASYATTSAISDISFIDHNDLLYALTYAPLLTKRYSPSEVRTWLASSSLPPECPSELPQVLAAKSENTKPVGKVRETYSACDIVREVTTEFDRSATGLL